MDILAKQFANWQAALDEFQKNIEKDLSEIRQQKEEVQRMKADIIDKLDKSRYLRDDNRLILSAPEIIIGNVDKSGLLKNGASKVIIRGSNINLDGVGANESDIGCIVSRAASIRQIAVDPGKDGVEQVVKGTSEIISQARAVVLRGESTTENYFPNAHLAASTGILLSTDGSISLDATLPCDTLKDKLAAEEQSLSSFVSDLKAKASQDKSNIANLIKRLDKLAAEDTLNDDATAARTNYLDIEDIHTEFRRLSSNLYRTMTRYFDTLSRLAEANRQLKCLKEQEEEVNKRQSSFKDKTTETFISLQAERVNLASIDGDGNLRENDDAGISLAGKKISLTSYGNDSALIPEGGIFMGSREVEINTANPKLSGEDIDLPAEGSVRVVSKDITLESVDYEYKSKKTQEKSLAKDGAFTVRAEKINLNATDTEGKATGSIAANAKAVEVKAMDVDKEKRTDKSLASGSTLLLLAEKVYAGSKDKKTKSQSVQIASDKVGVFGDTTVELQQDKAILQLSGGDASLAGGKTTFYGDTTAHGKVTFKSDITAGTVDMKNLKVQTSFKTPYTTEGFAAPGAPSTAKLGAKLKEEELKSTQ